MPQFIKIRLWSLLIKAMQLGEEILALAEAIEADIKQKFDITLQREVNVVG
jgi:UDP-N-acetylenolpyruvoylglucosamine reductase